MTEEKQPDDGRVALDTKLKNDALELLEEYRAFLAHPFLARVAAYGGWMQNASEKALKSPSLDMQQLGYERARAFLGEEIANYELFAHAFSQGLADLRAEHDDAVRTIINQGLIGALVRGATTEAGRSAGAARVDGGTLRRPGF